VGDQFWGEIWDLLSRMGCDHPCVSFVFSCGYLGLFYHWWCAHVYMCALFVVWARFSFWDFRVSLFLFVSCFVLLYSLLCFGFWLFVFVGVVAIWLLTRTLWDLGMGEEPNCLQNVFGVFGVILYYFIQLWSFVAWLLVCIWVEVHDRYLSQVCHSKPRFQPCVLIVVL